MTTTERKPLTKTDRIIVSTAAKLRCWSDCLQIEAEEEGATPNDFRLTLATELKKMATELWELVD